MAEETGPQYTPNNNGQIVECLIDSCPDKSVAAEVLNPEGQHLLVIVDDGAVVERGTNYTEEIERMFTEQIEAVQDLLVQAGIILVVIRPEIPIQDSTSAFLACRALNCAQVTEAALRSFLPITNDYLHLIEGLKEYLNGKELIAVIADGLFVYDPRSNYSVDGFKILEETMKSLGLEAVLWRYSHNGTSTHERYVKKGPGKLAGLLTELAGRFVPQTA